MNRFYCTVCKKVKRVQHYPQIISNQHDEVPTNRVGMCDYHSGAKSDRGLRHAARTNQPVMIITKTGGR